MDKHPVNPIPDDDLTKVTGGNNNLIFDTDRNLIFDTDRNLINNSNINMTLNTNSNRIDLNIRNNAADLSIITNGNNLVTGLTGNINNISLNIINKNGNRLPAARAPARSIVCTASGGRGLFTVSVPVDQILRRPIPVLPQISRYSLSHFSPQGILAITTTRRTCRACLSIPSGRAFGAYRTHTPRTRVATSGKKQYIENIQPAAMPHCLRAEPNEGARAGRAARRAGGFGTCAVPTG